MEKIVIKIIEQIISRMSDSLRGEIIASVKRLEQRAKETENPWDDIAVLILKVALDIE